MTVEVDFDRIIAEEAKAIAEGNQYAIKQLAVRAMQSKEFVTDIALAIGESALADRDDFDRNYRGVFPFEWYTYSEEGGHVDYRLRKQESISDVAPIVKGMTTRGWKFIAKPDPSNARVVYHFERGDQCGNFIVRISESASCKLIEDGEEIIPSRVNKKYRIVCEPSLESLPYPDGDEEQQRIGFTE